MAAKADIDSDLVRRLAALLEETGLTEIEYARGDWRVRVARRASDPDGAPAPAAAAAIEAPPDPGEEAATPGAVTSPMVGTVFLAPEPGSRPFVEPGDTVAEGDTLLLVEAMKTYNEVRAPHPGKVARILVADGTPVEYGEPLLILE